MKLPQLLSLPLLLAVLSSTLAQTTTAETKATKKTTTAVAETPKKADADAAPKAKRDWYPFHGVVSGVNPKASTISLHKEAGERILRMDGKSTLTHLGKPATLADVKTGEYAHGKVHKNERGEEVITAAKFDKEAPTKEPKKESKKESKKSKKAEAETSK